MSEDRTPCRSYRPDLDGPEPEAENYSAACVMWRWSPPWEEENTMQVGSSGYPRRIDLNPTKE